MEVEKRDAIFCEITKADPRNLSTAMDEQPIDEFDLVVMKIRSDAYQAQLENKDKIYPDDHGYLRHILGIEIEEPEHPPLMPDKIKVRIAKSIGALVSVGTIAVLYNQIKGR